MRCRVRGIPAIIGLLISQAAILHRLRYHSQPHAIHFDAEPILARIPRGGAGDVPHTEGRLRGSPLTPFPLGLTFLVVRHRCLG